MQALQDVSSLLRHATPNDLDRVYKFYVNANHPDVLPRDPSEYKAAIDRGVFYLLECKGKMVAGAGAFPLSDDLDCTYEFGSAYVSPDFRGHGIQLLMLRARATYTAIYLNENPTIYTAVKPKNAGSLAGIRKSGFVPFGGTDPALIEPCVQCPSKDSLDEGRICCCDFWIMPQEIILQNIDAVLNEPICFRPNHAAKRNLKIVYGFNSVAYQFMRERLKDN